ncbi:MAG: beta-lactamase family protein [Actinobacteria bacterium]|nr:beta-lactamase family protein [Actinomycetota bacterium]
MTTAPLDGYTRADFSGVRDAFAENFDRRIPVVDTFITDVGASVAVTVEGETVVDLWGGYRDPERTELWERDTTTPIWSASKTLMTLCALVLVDRGRLDLDRPVAEYWPEFGTKGKEKILVRQCLSHTAGLPVFVDPMEMEESLDWELVTRRIVDQEPLWEPGTESGYHGWVQGFLVGEIVRRASGRTLGRLLREDITEPLGIDAYIGVPTEKLAHISNVIASPRWPKPDHTHLRGRVHNPVADFAWTRTPRWQQAELPSVNGYANARALSVAMAVLANGGEAKGVKLLSPETAELVLEEQCYKPDNIFSRPIRWGLGFALSAPDAFLPTPNPRSCYWGGGGGSIVFVDYDARMTISYVMNQMSNTGVGDERALSLLRATYAALGIDADGKTEFGDFHGRD